MHATDHHEPREPDIATHRHAHVTDDDADDWPDESHYGAHDDRWSDIAHLFPDLTDDFPDLDALDDDALDVHVDHFLLNHLRALHAGPTVDHAVADCTDSCVYRAVAVLIAGRDPDTLLDFLDAVAWRTGSDTPGVPA